MGKIFRRFHFSLTLEKEKFENQRHFIYLIYNDDNRKMNT